VIGKTNEILPKQLDINSRKLKTQDIKLLVEPGKKKNNERLVRILTNFSYA